MKTRGKFFMIKEMYQQGMSITDIANELKMDRKTVKKIHNVRNHPNY
nr:helix-turn-helix domain-containing protein [Niallia taxi]